MEEIIADYEEHFQVGVENGKTEEQICEDLGSIEDLVAEIKDVYGTEKKSEKKQEKSSEEKTNTKGKFFGEWNFKFDNITGESISNAINSALNTAGEALSNIDVKELGENVKKVLRKQQVRLTASQMITLRTREIHLIFLREMQKERRKILRNPMMIVKNQKMRQKEKVM